MLDLDLMDFISAHLRVMKLSDTASQPTFLIRFVQLKCYVIQSKNITTNGILYLTKLSTFVSVVIMDVFFSIID